MKQYSISDFSPLWDNLIVKPIVLKEKDGYVRPRQEEDKSEVGEIVSIGTSVPSEFIKPGDIVLFNKFSSTETDLGKELVVRWEDIVAVLKQNDAGKGRPVNVVAKRNK